MSGIADLVDRLRQKPGYHPLIDALMLDAADEIERLRRQLEVSQFEMAKWRANFDETFTRRWSGLGIDG